MAESVPTSIKIVDMDLGVPGEQPRGLGDYREAWVFVRWFGQPVTRLEVPILGDTLDMAELRRRFLEWGSESLLRVAVAEALRSGRLGRSLDAVLRQAPEEQAKLPSVSVAICTRDRPEDITKCLEAVQRLKGPVLEVIVVDNAPTDDRVRKTVIERFGQSETGPPVRYVCEPRPGLDWARNRAIYEAQGEIVAFTDDDVIVDPGWATAIAEVFADDPNVGAATGLVIPHELETGAQILFERNGGFSRGFQRYRLHFPKGSAMPWENHGVGVLGTGANMAFRRDIFARTGYFDPALDVGTQTNGGGDLEMYFRVLKSGLPFVYEPSAMVRHRHRRDYATLRKQIFNNGSLFAKIQRSRRAFPDSRRPFRALSRWWGWHGLFLPWAKARMYRGEMPSDLKWAQIIGSLRGFRTYDKARRRAEAILVEWHDQPQFSDETTDAEVPGGQNARKGRDDAIAVRRVEITALAPINDVTDYARTRVFLFQNDVPIGELEVWNHHLPISRDTLAHEIARSFSWNIAALALGGAVEVGEVEKVQIQRSLLAFFEGQAPDKRAVFKTRRARPLLPKDLPVSVVIGSYERPSDLRDVLQGLVAQRSARPIEIIVADNNPSSSSTRAVVETFPNIRLVSEPRRGVAYARNAAILAATGEIIATVDDDVLVSPDWLERLLRPFARNDVLAVTGHVLPHALEHPSQQHFEAYGEGGLGRGFVPFEFNRQAFNGNARFSVPVWALGGTANAAFRARIFRDPKIGLLDEALGPGMPSGVGEDIYLFYKILRAGGTIVYEPSAYVWHKHRQDMAALRAQIYGYSKGFVAYQLTTLLQDGDLRALGTLLYQLPKDHLGGLWRAVRGRSPLPVSLKLTEIRGNLAGPFALWQSRRRVARQGRSC